MGFPFHSADDHQGLAKVALGVARGVGQGNEHLPGLTAVLPYVVLEDGVLAAEPVLVPQPLEDPLGRVALLLENLEVLFQDPVDNAGEGLQLGAPGGSLPPVSPEGRSRPASSVQCPGAARTSGRPPGCSCPPPSPPCEPADTIPLGTSLAPSMGSTMTLWMTEGGTVFNRQMSAIYPPAWSNLTPPFTAGCGAVMMARDGKAEEKRNRFQADFLLSQTTGPRAAIHTNRRTSSKRWNSYVNPHQASPTSRSGLTIHICRSSRNSDTGSTPQTNR